MFAYHTIGSCGGSTYPQLAITVGWGVQWRRPPSARTHRSGILARSPSRGFTARPFRWDGGLWVRLASPECEVVCAPSCRRRSSSR